MAFILLAFFATMICDFFAIADEPMELFIIFIAFVAITYGISFLYRAYTERGYETMLSKFCRKIKEIISRLCCQGKHKKKGKECCQINESVVATKRKAGRPKGSVTKKVVSMRRGRRMRATRSKGEK